MSDGQSHHTVHAATGAAALVLVAALGAGGHVTASAAHGDRPTALSADGAASIVHDPESTLTQIAVAPRNAEVRASLWTRCTEPACLHHQQAIAVTTDGFAHQTDLMVAPTSHLEWAAGGGFAVNRPAGGFAVQARGGGLELVSGTGVVTALQVSATASALLPKEALVNESGGQNGTLRSYGIDIAAHTAHPIPRLPGNGGWSAPLQRTGIAADLFGINRDGSRVWFWRTDFGGWSGGPFVKDPFGGHWTFAHAWAMVPSDDVGWAGVLTTDPRGAMSAELWDLASNRMADWGATGDGDFKGLKASWAAVTPSGRLLMMVYSPAPGGRFGLYESQDPAWQTFARVPIRSGLRVGSSAQAAGLRLLDTSLDQGRQTLDVADQRGVVRSSTDGGRTWHEVATR